VAGSGDWPGGRDRADAVTFAIGAKRIAPLRRLLDGLADDGWHDAIEMDNAQVAVAEYCPDWWPANTRLLIRRVRLDPAQVSADPRSRRRRTLHPDQRALPIPELDSAGPVYAYSFILTSLDVSSPDKAAAAEHWYRHRTTVEHRAARVAAFCQCIRGASEEAIRLAGLSPTGLSPLPIQVIPCFEEVESGAILPSRPRSA
jgi:hypothetical protein